MSNITFRPCQPNDVDLAVPLIYSSGPAAFDYVFYDRTKSDSIEFLKTSFVGSSMEFSHTQHTAALDVATTNPRAHALYKRIGFADSTIRKSKLESQFGRVVDHMFMEMPIE